LSRQIANAFEEAAIEEVQLFDEVKGKGIVAIIDKHLVKVGSAALLDVQSGLRNSESSLVYVEIDGVLLGYIRFINAYRPQMATSIKSMGQHYRLSLLSGDGDQEASVLRPLFGEKADLHFRQSPSDKLIYISNRQKAGAQMVMMVGDGLNDAGALQQASIGVAVSEQAGQFTPASDVIMEGQVVPRMHQILAFSRDTRKVIFANLSLSLLYNTVGLSFALTGALTPVVSAILMPVSSISVVISATVLTNYFARKNHLI
jgi:Cu+-exporting ATPase